VCGTRGYTSGATVPAAAAADGAVHVLEARTRRRTDGAWALTVLTDGVVWHRQVLAAELVAGLEGPVGVRSDNGAFALRLAAGSRTT
jgi:hypothetical protein